ncbi:hypothetical protein J5X84_38365 [Streptosporangiaceae bacterium NEAU-GS5]|nr:hypothetical protein [Streptosporangiaceae bacterium NEAU-GS5]
MQPLTKVEFPDGEVIWVRVDGRPGPTDSGLRDGGVRAVQNFTETIRAVAANVQRAVEQVSPDEVSVEFGMELAVDKEGVVAALAGISGSATLTVTLTWSRSSAS